MDDPDNDERIELVGDLAEQYLDAMKRHRERACSHPKTDLREKAIAGGGIQCKPQCLFCGFSVGNPVKKQSGLPKWDDALLPRYEASRTAEREAIQRKFVQLHKAETEQLKKKSKCWQAEYAAYRRTPIWQNKRARVLKRADGICEGCLDAHATVVHHTTYSHMGDELLYQLVALC